MSEIIKAPETGPISIEELQTILTQQYGLKVEIIGIKTPGGEYRELTEEDKHG